MADAPRPPEGDWLGTPYLVFERRASARLRLAP